MLTGRRTFLVSIALLVACAGGNSAGDNPTNEGALETNQVRSFICSPIDGDEACVETNAGADSCVTKLSITARGSAQGALKIERQATGGGSLPAQSFDDAVTFGLKKKSLQGAWNDGDVHLSVRKTGPGDTYDGSASLPDVGTFAVECRVEGSAPLPLYLKTVRPYEECNGTNPQGQILRCVKGASCNDENGEPVAVLQRKRGICEPHLLHTAKSGEACNVNPQDSVALVLCERNAGLHCKNATGQEIPLAQSTQGGTCQ